MSFIPLIILLVTMLSFHNGFRQASHRSSKSLINRLFSSAKDPTSPTWLSNEPFNLQLSASTSLTIVGDTLIVPFYKPKVDKKDENALTIALKDAIPKSLDSAISSIINDIIDEGNFKADSMSKVTTRLGSSSQSVKYLTVVGLGAEPKADSTTSTAPGMEVAIAIKFGKVVASITKELKSKSASIVAPSTFNNAGLSQFLIGYYDGVYLDRRYKSDSTASEVKQYTSSSLSIIGCNEAIAKDIALNHKLTKAIVAGVEFAKDLVNAPPCSKTPLLLAQEARVIAKESGGSIQCTVLGEKECTELGMGGYLGVQKGSMFPPQFIHMTYKPDQSVDQSKIVKVALVGKGLTFDSGGYNLKAGAGSMIEMMKFDMGGAAAVLGCAKAIAQLKPKNVEVHWISAVCENMISANAMRPGDVLVTSNGKTIEVANTDAEGRLTLADALVYADKLDVDIIIDLATLTGACMVGLGDKVAGLYSADSQLLSDIQCAAKRTDESLWQLPLESGYKDMIKSHIADLKNVGGKSGGSITAALFLQEFVEKAKWAHIDMAGPVWDNKEMKPTGFGVKFLVDYLLNAKKA